ncbi:MAG: hypothetical protein WC454_02760 [Phycisphaerae bacterium]|jgi:hypothetical protein
MNKSQFRAMMLVLCLAALCAVIAGCQEEAACPKAKDVKATAEKAPAAVKPVAEAKPAPAPKPAAAAVAGPTLGPFKLAKNWAEEQGFVANWLICGTFPNLGERPDNTGFGTDYLKNYGGEAAFTPANGMEIKIDGGSAVKFLPYATTGTDIIFGDVAHLKIESNQEKILVYCACWLDSDADKDVEIRVGSDDGYKLWINHQLVSEQHVYRAMEMDQETHKVKLNKGKNLLLIKVDQDTGEYQFMLRVVGADGKEAPGVTVWN